LHDGVVLGEEVEFNEVADIGNDVFWFDYKMMLVAASHVTIGLCLRTVKATVGGGRAGEDAVDNSGGADLVGWCCGSEAEQSGGCESNGCESDHIG
jgi:hypothetical protein